MMWGEKGKCVLILYGLTGIKVTGSQPETCISNSSSDVLLGRVVEDNYPHSFHDLFLRVHVRAPCVGRSSVTGTKNGF